MKKSITTTLVLAALTAAMTCSCSVGKPDINGKEQPIEHGWTLEQAAEFWLASVISDRETAVRNGEREPLTAKEIASLSEGHVRVSLPLQEGDPMPRMGATYRQAATGGYITFSDTTINGDSLHTMAVARYQLREPLYFNSDSAESVSMVQHRGNGIFTLYHYRTVRDRETQERRQEPEWDSAIISIYPNADSLLISRGAWTGEAYMSEKK